MSRENPPFCDACIVPLTLRHLLVEYPSLGNLRDRFLSWGWDRDENFILATIIETCRAIVTAFGDEELQVPQTPEACQEVAQGFEERWTFPRIIGAIDGKHIRLRNSPKGGTHYFKYKKFFSMVLLAVADASYKFLYIDVGATGWCQSTGWLVPLVSMSPTVLAGAPAAVQ
ncbi:uncharacterized protein [Macrobrachium rosenbergii]|uniref:uncharacterized protein n=1 Tax=Macrobrachium rosenbergii TaxID=79674 RepID=UPI0034D4D791